MNSENLRRSNELENEIKEVKYFLHTLGSVDKEFQSYKMSFINIEVKKTISLFANRSFGCGSHNSNIVIPSVLLGDLTRIVEKHLRNLEKEYNKL